MVLTDERWAALAPLLEACRPKGKTPPRDLRRTVEAIVWRHADGAKWRGRAHELPLAPGLLGRLPRVPLWVVGDRGYSADAFRELIWSSGARPAIPTRSNEAAVACPDYIYNNRNLVERLWGRLKEWRAVATRYEKTAASYLGVLCLAATMDWLKP